MTLDVYLGRRQSVNVAVAAVLDRAAASQAVYWS
jgi:hypothetical protein